MAEKGGPPPSYGESTSADAGIPPPPPTYTEPTKGGAEPPPPPSYAEPSKGAAFGQPQPIQSIQPAQPTTVVILQQPGNTNFTNNIYPQRMQCPSCQAQITTRLEHTTGSCVWLWCVCLVFSGLFLFAWLPFVMNSCKDVHHYCPSCNHKCGYRGRAM